MVCRAGTSDDSLCDRSKQPLHIAVLGMCSPLEQILVTGSDSSNNGCAIRRSMSHAALARVRCVFCTLERHLSPATGSACIARMDSGTHVYSRLQSTKNHRRSHSTCAARWLYPGWTGIFFSGKFQFPSPTTDLPGSVRLPLLLLPTDYCPWLHHITPVLPV